MFLEKFCVGLATSSEVQASKSLFEVKLGCRVSTRTQSPSMSLSGV